MEKCPGVAKRKKEGTPLPPGPVSDMKGVEKKTSTGPRWLCGSGDLREEPNFLQNKK